MDLAVELAIVISVWVGFPIDGALVPLTASFVVTHHFKKKIDNVKIIGILEDKNFTRAIIMTILILVSLKGHGIIHYWKVIFSPLIVLLFIFSFCLVLNVVFSLMTLGRNSIQILETIYISLLFVLTTCSIMFVRSLVKYLDSQEDPSYSFIIGLSSSTAGIIAVKVVYFILIRRRYNRENNPELEEMTIPETPKYLLKCSPSFYKSLNESEKQLVSPVHSLSFSLGHQREVMEECHSLQCIEQPIDYECPICLEVEGNIVFFPCLHGTPCVVCASSIYLNMRTCYICRAQISYLLEISNSEDWTKVLRSFAPN